MGQTHRTAGTATITEVARHWRVDRETAIRILEDRGVPFVDVDGPLQVAWTDVWSVEGAGFVAPANYEAFKKPLLRVERLGVAPDNCRQPEAYMELVKLKPSALRARVAKIGQPIIRLSQRKQRVRPCDLDAFLDQC